MNNYRDMHTFTYVRMLYAHMLLVVACIYIYTYMYIHSHAHMYVCMYVNTHQVCWVTQTCCSSEDGVGILPLGVTYLRKGREELRK